MAAPPKFPIKSKSGAHAMSARNCAAAKLTPIEMAKNAIIWIGC
jgi:hypothetical protein